MIKEKGFYHRWGKRGFDLLLTIPALVILAPVMGFIAFLVRVNLGRHVIYRQQRPGLLGSLFAFYKFRTMNDARDAKGDLLPDEKRITRLGRVLRKTSLDELPELWNVLKGDMSLVGPRPLLVEYLERYSPEQARRHEVKPGITGLWQTSGRSSLSFEERLNLDESYIRNWSLWMDIIILIKTIRVAVSGEGAF